MEIISRMNSGCNLIELPKIVDPRGNLSIIEQLNHIPFAIRRVHWIYDVPGGFDRGGHAYKETDEFIIALSGSFDVIIDDIKTRETFSLNRSYKGLFVPRGKWRTMTNFSTNSVALVLSSSEYDAEDYIFDYKKYCKWSTKKLKESILPKENFTAIENSANSKILKTGKISVFSCSLFELSKIHDVEGNLTYIYENEHVPFPINRVFYSYDIPGGESRGAHAHKKCHQFIIAASGSFEVALSDGVNKRTILLNRPFWGLHVPPGIWASEQGFSSGSICLVLASDYYDEDDYIRDYDEYLNYINNQKK